MRLKLVIALDRHRDNHDLHAFTTFTALRTFTAPGARRIVNGVRVYKGECLMPVSSSRNTKPGVATPENSALAKKLGAHHYIDSKAANAAEELKKLGGANVILATAPSSKAMSEIFHGLGRNGSLLVVGADMAAIEIPGAALISGRKRVQGWASGTPSDSEDTLRFAALTGVRPMVEKFPLEKVSEAYARMTSGHAQFRVVLTM